MNSTVKKNLSGFTIVELLIVVVVIAILATITVVSYNGISARATNARVVTAAKSYATLIEMYKQETGNYPNVEAEYVCLPGTYTAGDGFSTDTCEIDGFNGSTPTSYTSSSGNNIKTMLETYQQNLPDASYGKALDGMAAAFPNQKVRGIMYSDDGGPQIIYQQSNSSTCPFGVINMAVGSKGVTCIYYFPSN